MNEIEQIYICAVRYSLGRRTYITSVISDYLTTQELSEKCKSIMIRDIKDADIEKRLGDNCDRESWMRLYNYLTKQEEKCEHNYDFVDYGGYGINQCTKCGKQK